MKAKPSNSSAPSVQQDEISVDQGARNTAQPTKILTGDPCPTCRTELSAIRINVDGNTLLMESCDGCDSRRWQLAGDRIDLQEALDQVGEHSGRQRPQT